jgi:hypothetical protein
MMSEKNREELTEKELQDAAGGYKTRRAQDPTNLDARTRRAGGGPGGKVRFAGDQEMNEAELGGVDAGARTRQAGDPTVLDARTRRAGGQGDGKVRFAGDEEVTEL